MENMVNGMILVNVHIHVDHMERKHKRDHVTNLHQVMAEEAVKINIFLLVQVSKPSRVIETLIVQVRVKTLIFLLYFTNKSIVLECLVRSFNFLFQL